MIADGDAWRGLLMGFWSDVFVGALLRPLHGVPGESAPITSVAATGFQIVADPVPNVAERIIPAPKTRI